jgi:ATP adenylyltransferase
VSGLGRKRQAAGDLSGDDRGRRNPFLPYDPDLYVADASDSHVCLLNKFNVVDHHLLIVTRHFEHQDTLLTHQDFAAFWRSMAEYQGLGFYNSGTVAGASQPHKHLQIVPLPLAPDGPRIPMEPRIQAAGLSGTAGRLAGLPFPHAIARLEDGLELGGERAARESSIVYHRLLQAVGLGATADESIAKGPYNLLLTRQWMLLVPRTRESCESVSLNALAFAGAMLVRDEAQLTRLRRRGLMAALRHVTSAEPK